MKLLEGMRENPQPPNNSCPKEVITAYQYPCIVVVQRPSFYEPRMVIVVKCLLQHSKALGCRNSQKKVVNS